MLLNEERIELEELDELDQARATDMEESRPIYPSHYPASHDAPVEEEPSPKE